MKEHDSVISNRNIGIVPNGTKGVIVHEFKDGETFEVEFFDEEGKTITLYSVKRKDLTVQSKA